MILQIGLVILLIIGFVIISRIINNSIVLFGKKKAVADVRVSYVIKMLQLGLIAIGVLLTCLILGVGYGQLEVFFSSVFAVVGIALFAQWSILSNITASLIIFFGFPYHVGDWVKVVDKDEEILGQIIDISSFHVIIQRLSGDVVTYPNSLILQKPVIRFADEKAARHMSQYMEKLTDQQDTQS
ncbi:mechanosensitive ion channel domain-containing protein [Marinomonas pollencensis]|uniref:Small-conductance mechanosensitive channel n=1 Tax=Marinomonas pollencensis TaxID=491954 RepID=A0A3E0D9T6_9GAMM|nr:mechanosensitive ion channel domain-containing protein [Marinomonas pollencensis]REG79347.1 mechanosensitive ion channel-like protein [Marinomonas pollencensis]